MHVEDNIVFSTSMPTLPKSQNHQGNGFTHRIKGMQGRRMKDQYNAQGSKYSHG